jgi:hypothetical protein
MVRLFPEGHKKLGLSLDGGGGEGGLLVGITALRVVVLVRTAALRVVVMTTFVVVITVVENNGARVAILVLIGHVLFKASEN